VGPAAVTQVPLPILESDIDPNSQETGETLVTLIGR